MTNNVFSYHHHVVNYFKKQPKTWNWFKSREVQTEQLKKQRTEILKNTYRLPIPENQSLYQLAEEAKQKLSLKNKINIYQELDAVYANARVSHFENEIDIVFSGDVLKRLNQEELLALFGHELSHILFYQLENGDFEVANRVVNSIANEARSSDVMIETARLFRLYLELFCDRGGLKVTENIDNVITSLVKVSSGLPTVDANSYLKQANEIFKDDLGGTKQITHPETFIRARALEIFQKGENDEEITKIIDAKWGMNKLDIFKRDILHQKTRHFVDLICKPNWIRTDDIFTLSRQYFPDFSYNDEAYLEEEFIDLIDNTDDTVREYFSYVLLDYATSDPSLDELPLGHTFQVAEQLGFHKTYRQLLKNEMSLTVKKLDSNIKKAILAVSSMNESSNESFLKDN